jgi:outer membrane protein
LSKNHKIQNSIGIIKNPNLKKMNIKYILLFLLITTSTIGFSQEKPILTLTLEETIALAQSDAPDVLIAKTRLSNNYWIFKSFEADYKPQISFNATLPSFNRTINQVIQPDGSITFTPQSYMFNDANISVTQRVSRTGATVFASTGLERIDFFNNNTKTYLSNPIRVGFSQPIFGFNSFKWDKKIQPLEFDLAKRGYSENMEAVATGAAALFFDVYIAQISVSAAEKDKANADTLYTIAKGRFSVGKIAETDLLQVEISKMNSDASLAKATLDLQASTENLRNFLGIKNAVDFDLIPPTSIPDFNIDVDKALKYALMNRSEIIAFEQQRLNAERGVAQAIGNNGIDINLSGQVGFSQTDATLAGAYTSPLDQERLTLRLSVPIMDWGKAESERQIAESNLKLVSMQIEQDRINFEQNIRLRVLQFDLVRVQAGLAERTYIVSQKNFDITKKRYLIGKIGVTELNLAIAEQGKSRKSYMSTLRNFWLAHYEIRRLTLYDFMNNKELQKEVDFN